MSRPPLKNVTFAVGLSWLLYGALFFEYPDWDIGLSLLMAGCTYLTAEWSVSAFMDRKYARWPAAIFFAWLCVDGSYWLYWSIVRPEVMIREGQWAMSLCLFLLCGFIWRSGPEALQLLFPALRQHQAGPGQPD